MCLDDVHVHVLPLADFLAGDDIANIDGALISIISCVVKENVLGVVVGLVDEQELAAAVYAVCGHVAGSIV